MNVSFEISYDRYDSYDMKVYNNVCILDKTLNGIIYYTRIINHRQLFVEDNSKNYFDIYLVSLIEMWIEREGNLHSNWYRYYKSINIVPENVYISSCISHLVRAVQWTFSSFDSIIVIRADVLGSWISCDLTALFLCYRMVMYRKVLWNTTFK